MEGAETTALTGHFLYDGNTAFVVRGLHGHLTIRKDDDSRTNSEMPPSPGATAWVSSLGKEALVMVRF